MNKTLPLPDSWKAKFQQSMMRSSFELRLSQSMIEYLSATADDAHWDRSRTRDSSRPDNFIATSTSLEKKGLIVRKCQEEIEREGRKHHADPTMTGDAFWDGPGCYNLTPAGQAIVDLFKVVGIFVETEAAINRRKRKGRA